LGITIAATLQGSDYWILRTLADRADERGCVAVSMREIAQACRYHHDTVKRALARFCRSGQLQKYSRAGGRGCNKYQFTTVEAPGKTIVTPCTATTPNMAKLNRRGTDMIIPQVAASVYGGTHA